MEDNCAGSKKTTKENRVWCTISPPPSKLDFTDPISSGQVGVEVDVAMEKGLSLMDKEWENPPTWHRWLIGISSMTSMSRSVPVIRSVRVLWSSFAPILAGFKSLSLRRDMRKFLHVVARDDSPMRALSKLMNMSDPDLVLFVRVALVGNDCVHQLAQFNQKLAELSTTAGHRHSIDGIVVTKFDTVDDKVRAALSMFYTSGAPVMFVGCGQDCTDLKKLNVKFVMTSLLS